MAGPIEKNEAATDGNPMEKRAELAAAAAGGVQADDWLNGRAGTKIGTAIGLAIGNGRELPPGKRSAFNRTEVEGRTHSENPAQAISSLHCRAMGIFSGGHNRYLF